MRDRAVLLESLVLIRICSRDPGPPILAKQRLVGTIMSRRLQRNSRNSSGDTFFGGNGLPFLFRSPLLTVFKSLNHLATSILKKQDSLTPPNSVAKSATAKTAWRTPLPLGVWPLLSAIAAFAEDFLYVVYTDMSLGKNLAISLSFNPATLKCGCVDAIPLLQRRDNPQHVAQ